jgi:hypothetical protein
VKILLHLWGHSLSSSPAVIDCLLMGHGHGHGALLQKPLPLGSCREQKGAHVHYSPPPFCFCNPRPGRMCPVPKDAIFILLAHTSPAKKKELKCPLIGAASLNLACVGTREPLVTGTASCSPYCTCVLLAHCFSVCSC